MWKYIIQVLMVAMLFSPASGINLPNKGKYKPLSEQMKEVQEEQVTKPGSVDRAVARNPKPWERDSITDMTTTASKSGVSQECPKFVCKPVVRCGEYFDCGFDFGKSYRKKTGQGPHPDSDLCNSVVKAGDPLWNEYLKVCGKNQAESGQHPIDCRVISYEVDRTYVDKVNLTNARLSGLVSSGAPEGYGILVKAKIEKINGPKWNVAYKIKAVGCAIEPGSIIAYPAASGDDGYYYAGIGFGTAREGLSFGRATAGYRADGFIRFVDVQIPEGATITSAFIRTYAVRVSNNDGDANATVYFNDVANSTAPTDEAEFLGLALTSASVEWSIPVAETDTLYDTPSLIAPLNEIIASGLVFGGAITFVWLDHSSTTTDKVARAFDYDSGSKKPELHISWE